MLTVTAQHSNYPFQLLSTVLYQFHPPSTHSSTMSQQSFHPDDSVLSAELVDAGINSLDSVSATDRYVWTIITTHHQRSAANIAFCIFLNPVTLSLLPTKPQIKKLPSPLQWILSTPLSWHVSTCAWWTIHAFCSARWTAAVLICRSSQTSSMSRLISR